MFKIKPKIKSYCYNKKTQITVYLNSNMDVNIVIDCILNLFKYDKIIVITCIDKNSKLLEKLASLNIKCAINSIMNNNSLEIILLVNTNELKLIISDLIGNEESEDVYIYNVKQDISLEEIMHDENNISKMCDLKFLISLYEGIIDVSFDKKVYDYKFIKEEIKKSLM